MTKTLIIAEIGECFNGDMEVAKKLINISKEAGCDIAKFQTLDYENISDDDPERDWFRKIALDPDKIGQLVSFAREAGIDILFTPENVKTATWLLDAGLNSVKIASSSAADAEMIQFVANQFKTVFMSTGMASLDEVNFAMDCLHGVPEIYLMHCISEYPTGPLLEKRGLTALAPENAKLNMMTMLMQLFTHVKVGYSDHTVGILAPAAAVAMGAQVIEKHITLDRKTPVDCFNQGREYMGTDHVLSLEPAELKEMVRLIRETEMLLGPWKWERTEGEVILRDFLRSRFSEQ